VHQNASVISPEWPSRAILAMGCLLELALKSAPDVSVLFKNEIFILEPFMRGLLHCFSIHNAMDIT
jgi:hypothetical protein